MIIFHQTLKSLLTDALRVHKILSREEVKRIAWLNGYEQASGERIMRSMPSNPIPCIALNSKKKPIDYNEHIAFWKWVGGKTKWKK